MSVATYLLCLWLMLWFLRYVPDFFGEDFVTIITTRLDFAIMIIFYIIAIIFHFYFG